MSVKKKNSIRDLITIINSMPEAKKDYFVRCFNSFNSVEINNFNNFLADDDIKLYKELRDIIFKLIEKDSDENKNINRLTKYGLDFELSKTIYNYFDYIYLPYCDSQYIKSLIPETFYKIVEFVVKHIIIYKDYQYFLIQNYVDKFGLDNSNTLNRIITFLKYHISRIGEHRVSPELLKDILIIDFDFSKEYADYIYESIINNIEQIHKAYYVSRILELEDKIEKIDSFFEALGNKVNDSDN